MSNTPGSLPSTFPAILPSAGQRFCGLAYAFVGRRTASRPWLPSARQALLGDTRHWPHPRETPAELKSFLRAFGRLRTRIGHQVGGHAVPVQGPVEYDIANAALGGMHAWGDQPLDQEAKRWVLLAQFDSDGDAKMAWGEEGALYWLIRPEDLAAQRFDQARLTVQG
ncbi:DUF1963 domain-containing protein [Streptomyces ipomoeae]|uniref:DUF1963 domain-containing protein n=2 Tax=Streptomyces ipomoeae TaxID=103232 RepID=UPI00114746A1|nr:DUF1963 domain-containing protein [Streptomyces ipomoeae]TQE24397.1 DUF1963 domain-containing protein [Streptomyces ipomoeae]